MTRVTTTLELSCEVCGDLWEAECFADYPHHDLVPEFVNSEEAECLMCASWVLPRVGTDIGDVILKRFEMVTP